MKELLQNPNAFVMLDMAFSELAGVEPEYSEPDGIDEIDWVVAHASFTCNANGESGVYDFIFNLSNIDDLADDECAPKHVIEQLTSLRDAGFSYILFNQGC